MKPTKFIIYFSLLSLLLLVSCESQQKQKQANVTAIADEKMNVDDVIDLINSEKWEEVIENKKIILDDAKKHPKSELVLSLSRAYMEMQQYEKAISIAKKLAERNKDSYMALFTVGVGYDMLEQYDKAETYYLKSLKIGPYYARVNLNLASIYEKTNRNEDAVQQYLKAIALFHEHKFYKEVLDFSEAVLRLAPNNYLALYYLAEYYTEMKSPDKAEELYLASLKSNFRFASSNLALGEINEKKDKIDIAVQYYLTGSETIFNDEAYEDAIMIFKHVLELDPNNEIAKQYIETATELDKKK